MTGHLNSFWPGEGGFRAKMFQKFKCPGDCLGGCWSFDFTGTLSDIPRMVKDDTSDLEVACSVLRHLNAEANFSPVCSTSKKLCLGHDLEHFLSSRRGIRQSFTEEAELPCTWWKSTFLISGGGASVGEGSVSWGGECQWGGERQWERGASVGEGSVRREERRFPIKEIDVNIHTDCQSAYDTYICNYPFLLLLFCYYFFHQSVILLTV